MTPFLGSTVDRFQRRGFLAVTAAMLSLAAILVSLSCSEWSSLRGLALMCLCFSVGTLSSGQFIAVNASIPLLVEGSRNRANGWFAMTDSLGLVLAPVLSGLVLSVIDPQTFAFSLGLGFAVGALVVLFLRVPAAPMDGESGVDDRITVIGVLRYLVAVPRMMWLLVVNATVNFAFSFCFLVLSPLILTATDGDTGKFGLVCGAGAAGEIGPWLTLPPRRLQQRSPQSLILPWEGRDDGHPVSGSKTEG